MRGVQISIPGSDRVRPPWRMGVLLQFSRYSCTSASSSPRLEADLRPCRAFSLLLASRALCAAFAFKLVHTSVSTERLCEPQIDRVMNVSTEIDMAEVVRVIPDAQRDTALHIWPATTRKRRNSRYRSADILVRLGLANVVGADKNVRAPVVF